MKDIIKSTIASSFAITFLYYIGCYIYGNYDFHSFIYVLFLSLPYFSVLQILSVISYELIIRLFSIRNKLLSILFYSFFAVISLWFLRYQDYKDIHTENYNSALFVTRGKIDEFKFIDLNDFNDILLLIVLLSVYPIVKNSLIYYKMKDN